MTFLKWILQRTKFLSCLSLFFFGFGFGVGNLLFGGVFLFLGVLFDFFSFRSQFPKIRKRSKSASLSPDQLAELKSLLEKDF